MSNALAIAATTATLRNMLLAEIPRLDSELADIVVTTRSPDEARKGNTAAQLNLFLYQTAINGAWRNMDMPPQVRPAESGAPPLALNLHYLITAFGRESDSDAISHRVLGAAMSVLHDHPVLSPDDIRGALAGNDLADQFERLRITPLPMSIDEMSKLWTAFQTQYRVSTAYELTVVLIDSLSASRSPLPVLRRGDADRGVFTVTGSAPHLTAIRLPRSQPAARLGEDITIVGEQLSIADTRVRFTSPRLEHPIELTPSPGVGPDEINVHLSDETEDPEAFVHWVPGFYTVALVVRRPRLPTILSNELAFALAPQVTLVSTSPPTGPEGTINLVIDCKPRIVAGQRIFLLFGDRQVVPEPIDSPAETSPPDTSQPTTLTFVISDVSRGTYVARLRVDGVDSIPVVYEGTPPIPAFDPAQQVIVT